LAELRKRPALSQMAAELATYHGVGHSPHWEKPEPVAADIAAFAERALRAQPS
jgi:pimeloyl-ACP methyl ester carboxylesterase